MPVPTATPGRAGSYAEVAAAYALLERELASSRNVRIRVDRDGAAAGTFQGRTTDDHARNASPTGSMPKA